MKGGMKTTRIKPLTDDEFLRSRVVMTGLGWWEARQDFGVGSIEEIEARAAHLKAIEALVRYRRGRAWDLEVET